MPESDPAPPKAQTIMDVAREAGVSKSTVSLVLQGSPLIRDETAERVRAAAQRLGYVYNRRAAELRRKSTNTVGVVINDLMNPFFAEVLVGIERRLVDAGFIVLMAHTHEDPVRQRELLRSMREHHAAGLVLCPALGTTPEQLDEVRAWGVPLVVIVRPLGDGDYDYVGADNELGVQLATRHLLDAGHRAIGFIGGVSGIFYEQRLRGWRRALAEAGIAAEEAWIVAAEPTRAGGHAAMAALLARTPRPTAAVAYNDITAFGALAALGERGLRAGADFALVGFDNVLATAHANPPLSTVDIGPGRLGEQAAEALLARIADPGIARQLRLATPQLVIRQSG